MTYFKCGFTKNHFVSFAILFLLFLFTLVLCCLFVTFFCTNNKKSNTLQPIPKLYLNTTKITLNTTVQILCHIKNLFSYTKNEYFVHFTYMSSPPQNSEWADKNGNFTEIGYYRLLIINKKLFSKNWFKYKFEYGSVYNVSSTKKENFLINVKLTKSIFVGKIGCAIKWTEENEMWKVINKN